MDNQKWYVIVAWRKDTGNQIDQDILGWDKALDIWNKIVATGKWCGVEVKDVSILDQDWQPISTEVA